MVVAVVVVVVVVAVVVLLVPLVVVVVVVVVVEAVVLRPGDRAGRDGTTREETRQDLGDSLVIREFKDVVFEDVVFDNNRFYLILYLDVT